MNFKPVLQPAVLVRRYKRFLADVRLPNGEQITMHCPNTGAMTGCSEPGSSVWYSSSDNPKRKYAHTLEIVEDTQRHKIGIHSALANRLVEEWLTQGKLPALSGYADVQREAAIPGGSGRFDFRLSSDSKPHCYVEVKSMTLHVGNGLGLFPDAQSKRAKKHVEALQKCVDEGNRAVLLFCVQHNGIIRTGIASEIDPAYGEAVRLASRAGVEVLAYAADIQVEGVKFLRQLEFEV
jgi:sugar fermentation stimulation protein A